MRKTLILALLQVSLAEIHVWEPQILKQLYNNKQMQYSIANFGSVPYGHSIYGNVFKSVPLDGCNDIKPLSWDKNYGTLIVYMERGNCHFAQKVLSAQKIGAGLAIIGDTNDEDVHMVLPVEKTQSIMEKIKIPSILVQKEDAENIKRILDDSNQNTLALAIHFPLIKSSDVSNIRMILQVDDFRSYDSIL